MKWLGFITSIFPAGSYPPDGALINRYTCILRSSDLKEEKSTLAQRTYMGIIKVYNFFSIEDYLLFFTNLI